MDKILIDFTKRLPDINKYSQLPQGFSDYGRFAITNSNNLWFAGIISSHPSDTKNGFYWATSGGTVFISPRGSNFGFPQNITQDIIVWLLKKLGIKVKQINIRKE